MFEEDSIWWLPQEGHGLPGDDKNYPCIVLALTFLTRFEADEGRNTLCMWGEWDLPFAGELMRLFTPSGGLELPESSVLMEIDTSNGALAAKSARERINAMNAKYNCIPVASHRRRTDGHSREPPASEGDELLWRGTGALSVRPGGPPTPWRI